MCNQPRRPTGKLAFFMAPSAPPFYPAPQRKSGPNLWPWLALLAVVFFGFVAYRLFAALKPAAVQPSIGLIEVSGAISDAGASTLLGGTSGGARAFIRQAEAARKDLQIKAVLIRINSPGGSASASQEMYEAVMRLRREKPVICSMGDVAASGGYYTAAACNKIYANRATTTGSIGVITSLLNYQELFAKIGLDQATIKSGKFKDAGNPARPLTPEERQLFQQLINNLYNQFVDDVVAGRKEATKGTLTREKLLKLADGRVYTGEQAVKNGLIDETGDLYTALKYARAQGKLPEDAPITSLSGGGGGLLSVFGASSQSTVEALSQSAGSAFARGAMNQMQSEAKNLPTPTY